MRLNIPIKKDAILILAIIATAVIVRYISVVAQNGIQATHLSGLMESWLTLIAYLGAPYFIAALASILLAAALAPKRAGEIRLVTFFAAAWTYLACIVLVIVSRGVVDITGIAYWPTIIAVASVATISAKWLVCNWKLPALNKLLLLATITIVLAVFLPFFDNYMLRIYYAQHFN